MSNENFCICGSRRFYKKKNAMHVGLYCSNCNKWMMWVSQKNDCDNCVFYEQFNKKKFECSFDEKVNEVQEISCRCDKYKCDIK